VISPEQILQTAKDIGEPSVLNRAGGAPTLAVGIAHVFHKIIPMADMGFWYHFGICLKRCLSSPRWMPVPAQAALCCRICWVTSCRS
jgi:carbon starvation protein